MMSIDIDASDLVAAADQLDRDVKVALVEAVKDASEAGAHEAMLRAPRRTGNLAREIYAQHAAAVSGEAVVGSITAEADYAAAVAEGTKPHTIEARGGALCFSAGGAVLFRKRVQHPGTRPNPFMKGGEARAASELNSSLESGVENAAAKFNG